MADSQCGLCLSCGVPFIPMGEGMVEYDRLGNITMFWFQRQVREKMADRVTNPVFTSKGDRSHILHKSNHAQAVAFISDHRREPGLQNSDPDNDDGAFPFMRAPTGRSQALLAFWPAPDAGDLMDFRRLLSLVDGLAHPAGIPFTIDRELKVLCCRSCNSSMTMEFWFRYHLYVRQPPAPARLRTPTARCVRQPHAPARLRTPTARCVRQPPAPARLRTPTARCVRQLPDTHRWQIW